MAEGAGKISFGISLDNSQLMKDADEAKRILNGIAGGVNNSGQTAEAGAQHVADAVTAEMERAAKAMAQAASEMAKSSKEGSKAIEEIAKNAAEAAKNAAENATNDISDANKKLIEDLQKRVKELERQLTRTTNRTQEETDALLNHLKKLEAGIAGFFTFGKLVEYTKKVADVRGEFQKLEASFETMLGAKQKSDALMSQLIKTAATTPFGMTEVANGAKQLLAYGLEAEKVNETLIRLGDIAAGLSLPIGDLSYLYGTTMVQGRMYTQDLNQFLGRGIPLAKELAKQFGVAESQVKDLVTEGKVGFPEVEKAIISLTSEGGQFAGLMEAQSKTIAGQRSNIEDALEQMFNEIGKMTEGTISTALEMTGTLIENWKTIAKSIAAVVVGYGIYKGAVLSVMVAQKIASAGSVTGWLLQYKSIQTATGAVRSFNAALMANPIGAIIGVITAAASAIYMFSENTDEATESVNKFGESGAKQISQVNTLTTTLKGLTAGTSTHKKALDELNGILAEYGLKQLDEKANLEDINKARAQAIELIKEEGLERQRANKLEEASQAYNKKIEEAVKELEDDLQNAHSFNPEEQRKIREKWDSISMIISNTISENADKGADEIRTILAQKLDGIGIDGKKFMSSWVTGWLGNDNIMNKFLETTSEANEELDKKTKHIEEAYEAEMKYKESTMTVAEKQEALNNKLQKAGDGVHELYKNITELVQKYDGKSVDFKVNISEQVPEWMKGMSLDELQRLAKKFTVLGETEPNGADFGGKKMTQQELLQRGFLYAKAAEEKQTAEEKRNEYLNSDEYKKKLEEAKKEAERLEKEKFKRLQAIKKYEEEVSAQVAQAEIEIRQSQIEKMEDGYNKQIAIINLNYDRMKAEIKKREEDMLSALADNELNKWMNNVNPKATEKEQVEKRESILKGLTSDDLTDKQRAQLEAFEALSKEIRDIELGKVAGAEEAINDYLKQYGDYQAQKLAIAEEYAAKIKAVEKSEDTREQKDWKIRSIKAEQKQTNSQMEANVIMQRIDWATVFGNMGGVVSKALSPLLEDLKAYTKSSQFKNLGADQQRQIIDAMRNIRQQIGNTSDLNWKDLANEMQAYQNSLQVMTRLQNEYSALELELLPKIEQAKADLENAKKLGNEEAIKDATEALSGFAAQLADASESLSKAKDDVSTNGQILSQTADSVCQPISKISEFLNNANLGKIGEISNAVDELLGGIAGLKALNAGKTLAKGVSETGEVLADAAKDAADKVTKGFEKAGLIGKIIAAIIKILDAIKEQGLGQIIGSLLEGISDGIEGFFKNSLNGNDVKGLWNGIKDLIFGILEGIIGGLMNLFTGGKRDSLFGSNAKEVEEYTKKLAKESEALRYSIDKLKESIDKSYGAEAIKAYQVAYEDQQKRTENARLTLDKQMKYTDAHHSNSYYWNMSESSTKQVSEMLGINLRRSEWGDWAKLTAEQMEQIKIHLPKVWAEMLEQGEYDKSQYFEDYVNEAHALEELTNQIQTNLMGMSFESMRDGFVDSLMDMSKDADDFADDMAQTFQRALLKANIGKEYEKQMQDWYNAVTKEMEQKGGELEKDRIEYYQGLYRNIVTSAIKKRDEIAEITGYEDTEASREASKKGIATASQDSVDELNGRATAIQGHTFSISENTKLLTSITSDILRSVINIDHNTEDIPTRMAGMEQSLRGLKSSIDNIAMKGIKII